MNRDDQDWEPSKEGLQKKHHDGDENYFHELYWPDELNFTEFKRCIETKIGTNKSEF